MTLPSRTRSPSESFAEVSRRLTNSTEGRFTIIDERSKDSESFDDASSTDSDDHKFSRSFVTKTFSTLCPTATPIPLTVPRPANCTHLPLPQIRMTNSTGRFRVGKVMGDPGAASLEIPTTTTTSEKRIKRGRWECKEWYDQDLNDSKRSAKAPLAQWNDISFPVPILNSPNNHQNSNYNMLTAPTTNLSGQHSSSSTSSIHSHPPLAHDNTIFSMEEQSDDSDRENNLPRFRSVTPGMDIIQAENGSSTNPSTSIEKPNSLPLPPPVVNIPTSRSKLFGTSPDILSGRATPLEMQLHYGLERSLSGGGGNIFYPLFDPQTSSTTPNGIAGVFSSSVSSQDYSSGNAASQIIAIDSKIEQAMDLVKTHLMFAVREEVEILRAKIVELDSTIARLQNENAILREHVPQEILQNLDGSRSLSPALSNSTAPTTNAIVAAQ